MLFGPTQTLDVRFHFAPTECQWALSFVVVKDCITIREADQSLYTKKSSRGLEKALPLQLLSLARLGQSEKVCTVS